MKSATIGHFEVYNKEFNFNKYWEAVGNVNVRDEDTFYKRLMIGVFKSSPKLMNKRVNYDVEYEKVKRDEGAKTELFQTYSVLGMIGFWLNFKQIYRFDKDTLEMICNSECKDLSSEELESLKMPYYCFAIENEFEYRNEVIDSVMISRRQNEDCVLLSIYGFIKDDKSEKMLRVDLVVDRDKSLFEVMDEMLEDDCQEFIKKVINLIMYLSQPKVDIVKEKVSRNKSSGKNDKKVKSFYGVDYESNEVGCKLGNAIRNYRVVYQKRDTLLNPGSKSGSVKRPHSRCGHFHHYWVGKGRTDLIVKYVEPTFVLGGSKTATMHKVKN